MPRRRRDEGLVLGTDFITDVLLVAIRVDAPITLVPGVLATDVALRTICEAVTKERARGLSWRRTNFKPSTAQRSRRGPRGA
ncbi:hypothetical protein RLIN73S_02498 [Rhodanobacter lindaniclasticus]